MKYYEITKTPDRETEKAYGFVTGSNNAVLSHNLKYYYTWIPRSIIKIIDNSGLDDSCRLFTNGSTVFFYTNNKFYRMSTK